MATAPRVATADVRPTTSAVYRTKHPLLRVQQDTREAAHRAGPSNATADLVRY